MTENFPVHALVYISQSAYGLSNLDLEEILVDASAQNRLADVTGALLYDGLSFLQYIEGPAAGIASVLARIQRSRRHANLRVLADGGVAQRYFWNWSMACRHADASMIQRLEAARWGDRAHPHLREDSAHNDGLRLLSEFWAAAPPEHC